VIEEELALFAAPGRGLIGGGDDGQEGGGVFDAGFEFGGPLSSRAEVAGILPDGDGAAFAFVELLAEGFLEGFDPLSFGVRVT